MSRASGFSRRLITALLFAAAAGIVQEDGPAWFAGPGTAFGAGYGEQQADKTLSPYFFVKSDDSSVDQLPLKSTSTEVNIAGVIADVKVVQVYRNEGKKPLEAVYVFPASTRAAVYGMKMTIGERTITAEIRKREEARQAYEQAKQEGKSASLLEQQRPNVFQMNVANILPGDEIRTELQYTEAIVPLDGVYEFVYPTVVGPRYSNQKEENAPASEQWSRNPYLHQGEPTPYSFGIAVDLASGVPIREMACTSHQVEIEYRDASRAAVTLAASEKTGGNKDFILKYRLAGDTIDSGLLLYEGKDENFFLFMVQPPGRVTPENIPPRDYIFIVDVSGSMHGFPLDVSKRLLKDLVGSLRPTDTFNVLLFSGASQLLAERSLPATSENTARAVELIERQQGGGGTELLPAMERALGLPRPEGISRTVVIVTDGYVTVETEVFDLIRRQLGKANVFAFGIGSSVNRHLIEGIARVGAGEPFVISKPEEAPARAAEFRKYVQSPVLTQIGLDFSGFDACDVEPAGVPDVLAERPAIVLGKWRGQPRGKITVRGITGVQKYSRTVDVASVKSMDANSAIRYLWARSRIAQLSDYNMLKPNDERIGKLTDLALKYNLLSRYTSFVAIDTMVRRKEGGLETVKQPLPLPEGVSDLALPGAGGALAMRATAPMSAPPPSSAQRYLKSEARESAKGKSSQESPSMSDKATRGVRLEKLTVTGGLSESAVRQALEGYLEGLRNCRPKTSGASAGEKLTLKFTITSDGKVKSHEILSPGKTAKEMKECLAEAIRRWVFPASTGTGETIVTVILSFETGGKS